MLNNMDKRIFNRTRARLFARMSLPSLHNYVFGKGLQKWRSRSDFLLKALFRDMKDHNDRSSKMQTSRKYAGSMMRNNYRTRRQRRTRIEDRKRFRAPPGFGACREVLTKKPLYIDPWDRYGRDYLKLFGEPNLDTPRRMTGKQAIALMNKEK